MKLSYMAVLVGTNNKAIKHRYFLTRSAALEWIRQNITPKISGYARPTDPKNYSQFLINN